MNKILALLSIMFLSTDALSEIEIKKFKNKNIEVIKFQVPDRKFPGKNDVVAQIHFPKETSKKLPLIIHQHGSSRDGMKFKKWGGRTDEWGKRLIKAGLDRGYAVAVVDAFYKRKLQPQNKAKFPNAVRVSINLAKIYSQDKRIEKSQIFYTGFSYGASQVLKFQDARIQSQNPFKAGVAGEPGCNIVSNPAKTNFATMIIKGEESHYYPIACENYYKMIKEVGNKIAYISIPKVNHFFSLNGKISKGVAVNGCSKNILIRYADGSFKFQDGTPSDRRGRLKCFTKEAAGGEKNRAKLNHAIALSLNFFDKYR